MNSAPIALEVLLRIRFRKFKNHYTFVFLCLSRVKRLFGFINCSYLFKARKYNNKLNPQMLLFFPVYGVLGLAVRISSLLSLMVDGSVEDPTDPDLDPTECDLKDPRTADCLRVHTTHEADSREVS